MNDAQMIQPATKESSVARQLKEYTGCLERIDRALKKLSNRLLPVLGQPQTQAPRDKVPQAEAAPLAEELRQRNQRLDDLAEALEILTEMLEI